MIVVVGHAVMVAAAAVVVVVALVGTRPTGEAMKHRCGGQMFARHGRQRNSDLR